jgi:hypothetical protein
VKVEQHLSSGLVIRQDERQAVRFIMFETGIEGWDYATHGGTMLIVNFAKRPFGVTCQHVRKDFDWRQLVVTDERFGRQVAGMKRVYLPTQPVGDAVGSDVMDLLVVEFSEDVGAAFFGDAAYKIDPGTIGSSRSGDRLAVSGALKDQSAITDDKIAPVFALLEFEDRGAAPEDPVVRMAWAQFTKPQFSRLTGLSGAPVFNFTTGRLAGVVVRGGMQDEFATLRYIDVAHLNAFLTAIVKDVHSTFYRTVMPR